MTRRSARRTAPGRTRFAAGKGAGSQADRSGQKVCRAYLLRANEPVGTSLVRFSRGGAATGERRQREVERLARVAAVFARAISDWSAHASRSEIPAIRGNAIVSLGHV